MLRIAAVAIEWLEERRMLSIAPPACPPDGVHIRHPMRTRSLPVNIDVSRRPGNESEGVIAVDPVHPNRIFAVSNLESEGLFAAVSGDGGVHWSTRTIADGSDNLPLACCDPSVAYDSSGNLFLAYVDADLHSAHIVVSTNGGNSFRPLWSFRGNIDQPTVTAGAGMVWIMFAMHGQIMAGGAPDLGPGQVGPFNGLQFVPAPPLSNFGDIAIGPRGQVMVTCLSPINTSGPANIYVSVDADGLGPQGFGAPIAVTATNVGGFRTLPAQPHRSIDAEPSLAFDRSAGPHRGRAYLVYTDAASPSSNNTFTLVRFSDNNGRSWSAPLRPGPVRAPDAQFLPAIALDQSTGNIAVSWYDARGLPGVSTYFCAAIGRPTASGIAFSAMRISRGASNALLAGNAIDYGDYNGVGFQGGVLHAMWFDNSNSTANNPDGALAGFDMYMADVAVT